MKKENLVNPFKDKYPHYLSFSMTVLLLSLTFFLSMIVALQSQNIKQESKKLEQKLTEKNISQKFDDTKNWKTYTHTDKSISFSYPAKWEVVNNPREDPLAGINSIRIKGPEGTIYLTPKVEPGGACPPGYKEIIIGNKKESVCNYIYDNGVEAWEQIYIEFPSSVLEVRAYANKPIEQNRITIATLLSTFKFFDNTEKVSALEIYIKDVLTDWEKDLLHDIYWPKLKEYVPGDKTREVYLVNCGVNQTGLDVLGIPSEVENSPNIVEDALKKLIENHFGGFPDAGEIANYQKASGIKFKNKDSGINGIKLNNGALIINFYDSVAAYGGGSTRVGCMSTSVGLTAKQFPSVKTIQMCIDKYEGCAMDFQP